MCAPPAGRGHEDRPSLQDSEALFPVLTLVSVFQQKQWSSSPLLPSGMDRAAA